MNTQIEFNIIPRTTTVGTEQSIIAIEQGGTPQSPAFIGESSVSNPKDIFKREFKHAFGGNPFSINNPKCKEAFSLLESLQRGYGEKNLKTFSFGELAIFLSRISSLNATLPQKEKDIQQLLGIYEQALTADNKTLNNPLTYIKKHGVNSSYQDLQTKTFLRILMPLIIIYGIWQFIFPMLISHEETVNKENLEAILHGQRIPKTPLRDIRNIMAFFLTNIFILILTSLWLVKNLIGVAFAVLKVKQD